jgi:sulfatase maturation enzyme AslB (radical SAM superfamily)
MVNGLKYDVSKGGFILGWRNAMPHIREKKIGARSPCNECEKRTLCGYCPAFFELENGSGDTHSEYLCAMGLYRFQTIQNARVKGGSNAV